MNGIESFFKSKKDYIRFLTSLNPYAPTRQLARPVVFNGMAKCIVPFVLGPSASGPYELVLTCTHCIERIVFNRLLGY